MWIENGSKNHLFYFGTSVPPFFPFFWNSMRRWWTHHNASLLLLLLQNDFHYSINSGAAKCTETQITVKISCKQQRQRPRRRQMFRKMYVYRFHLSVTFGVYFILCFVPMPPVIQCEGCRLPVNECLFDISTLAASLSPFCIVVVVVVFVVPVVCSLLFENPFGKFGFSLTLFVLLTHECSSILIASQND